MLQALQPFLPLLAALLLAQQQSPEPPAALPFAPSDSCARDLATFATEQLEHLATLFCLHGGSNGVLAPTLGTLAAANALAQELPCPEALRGAANAVHNALPPQVRHRSASMPRSA
jgi:hypothetical protein